MKKSVEIRLDKYVWPRGEMKVEMRGMAGCTLGSAPVQAELNE